jgi:hypothetical protein
MPAGCLLFRRGVYLVAEDVVHRHGARWRDAGTAIPYATVLVEGGAVIGSMRFWNLERWSWPRASDPPPTPASRHRAAHILQLALGCRQQGFALARSLLGQGRSGQVGASAWTRGTSTRRWSRATGEGNDALGPVPDPGLRVLDAEVLLEVAVGVRDCPAVGAEAGHLIDQVPNGSTRERIARMFGITATVKGAGVGSARPSRSIAEPLPCSAAANLTTDRLFAPSSGAGWVDRCQGMCHFMQEGATR